MTIQAHRPVFSNPGLPSRAAVTAEQPAVAADAVSLNSDRKELDSKNFSWLDLGKGIAGAALGSVVEGAGVGASSLLRAPQVAYETTKGVWKSKMLGPVLKTTLTPVVLAAGLAAPVFAALGGTIHGMISGFAAGAEKSPLASIPEAVENVKFFHNDLAGQAVQGVQNLATVEPSNPGDVYEIKVIEAGKGLIGSVAGAAVVGAGVGASSLVNLPRAYGKVTSTIWESDASLPLKVGGQLLTTAGAAVAVPFAAVGGALWGLGTGAYNGYQDGVVAAGHEAAETVSKFHQGVREAIAND